MLKKTITYVDYNGTERTEDHYFNLNEAELMEMQVTKKGGMQNYMEKIIAAQDQAELYRLFKSFVLKAYGIKHADGIRFEKSEEISKAFEQTGAYTKLIMELSTNADEAAKFMNGIIPADMADKVDELLKQQQTNN